MLFLLIAFRYVHSSIPATFDPVAVLKQGALYVLAGNVSYSNALDANYLQVQQDFYTQTARIWNVDASYLFTVQKIESSNK